MYGDTPQKNEHPNRQKKRPRQQEQEQEQPKIVINYGPVFNGPVTINFNLPQDFSGDISEYTKKAFEQIKKMGEQLSQTKEKNT